MVAMRRAPRLLGTQGAMEMVCNSRSMEGRLLAPHRSRPTLHVCGPRTVSVVQRRPTLGKRRWHETIQKVVMTEMKRYHGKPSQPAARSDRNRHFLTESNEGHLHAFCALEAQHVPLCMPLVAYWAQAARRVESKLAMPRPGAKFALHVRPTPGRFRLSMAEAATKCPGTAH